ncbi:sigma-70 family RNA polymerase sigma factor [Clostridium perfringens]|nr:sigma-70 family RNA polymerase sigma factor [Clostridium perfringens]
MINKGNFLKQLKKKNEKALDYVIDSYSDVIFKVAYGVLKIWDNIHHFNKDEDKFYPWILAITKYTAIDILRKELRHSNTLEISSLNISEEKCLVSKFHNKEQLNMVTEEINAMKDTDREIFLRKFYLEETGEEISKKMGLSNKFINLRIFRGRNKLKAKFMGRDV